jgi:hypothetical protein
MRVEKLGGALRIIMEHHHHHVLGRLCEVRAAPPATAMSAS